MLVRVFSNHQCVMIRNLFTILLTWSARSWSTSLALNYLNNEQCGTYCKDDLGSKYLIGIYIQLLSISVRRPIQNTYKTIGCTVVVSIYKSLKTLLIILFSYFHLNKFSSLSSTILSTRTSVINQSWYRYIDVIYALSGLGALTTLPPAPLVSPLKG